MKLISYLTIASIVPIALFAQPPAILSIGNLASGDARFSPHMPAELRYTPSRFHADSDKVLVNGKSVSFHDEEADRVSWFFYPPMCRWDGYRSASNHRREFKAVSDSDRRLLAIDLPSGPFAFFVVGNAAVRLQPHYGSWRNLVPVRGWSRRTRPYWRGRETGNSSRRQSSACNRVRSVCDSRTGLRGRWRSLSSGIRRAAWGWDARSGRYHRRDEEQRPTPSGGPGDSNLSTPTFSEPRVAAPQSILSAIQCSSEGFTRRPDIVWGTLPDLETSLAGVSIAMKDSAGVERLAPLYAVYFSQINYVVPAGTGARLGHGYRDRGRPAGRRGRPRDRGRGP